METEAEAETVSDEAPAEKPKRTRRKKAETEEAADEKPKVKRARKKKADTAAEPAEDASQAEAKAEEKPKRTRRKKSDAAAGDSVAKQVTEDMAVVAGPEDSPQTAKAAAKTEADAGNDDGTPKRGWWQRTFGE